MMNPDLFRAILAMDAYNRTGGDVQGRSLAVEGSKIGNVTVGLARGVDSSGFLPNPTSTKRHSRKSSRIEEPISIFKLR
jgi:hypothetical protein